MTILSGNPTGSHEMFQDSAIKMGNPQIFNTPAPASYTGSATQTFLSADVLGGIIVVAGSAGSGAITATLPTAALLATAMRQFSQRGVIAGDTLWCLVINGNSGGANAVTLAAGSGGSFDANQAAASRVIAANSSKEIAVRFTNGAPGSEAYVVYT